MRTQGRAAGELQAHAQGEHGSVSMRRVHAYGWQCDSKVPLLQQPLAVRMIGKACSMGLGTLGAGRMQDRSQLRHQTCRMRHEEVITSVQRVCC
jgi:hypothetical protein